MTGIIQKVEDLASQLGVGAERVFEMFEEWVQKALTEVNPAKKNGWAGEGEAEEVAPAPEQTPATQEVSGISIQGIVTPAPATEEAAPAEPEASPASEAEEVAPDSPAEEETNVEAEKAAE